MSNHGHFDEGQEVFCIVAVIIFWCLSFCSPFFLLPAILIVFYVVIDVRSEKNETEQKASSEQRTTEHPVPKQLEDKREDRPS